MNVVILGAGKVGTALHRASPGSKLLSFRHPLPRRIEADLLILAVRDRDLGELAQRLAHEGRVSRRVACVHVAGAFSEEVLAPLRSVSAGVAQMHPFVSFASKRHPPHLAGFYAHVRGDRRAEQRARQFVRAIGMFPLRFSALEVTRYHAAAAVLANGAVALGSLAGALLEGAHVPKKEHSKLLGTLLRSVAENIVQLGFPEALTGPVRRGDSRAVANQLAHVPRAGKALVRASLGIQLELARALGEADASGLKAIQRQLAPSSI